MARNVDIPDKSAVVYETVVIYKGEKYTDPLFLKEGKGEFTKAFEQRFGKPILDRSERSRNRSDMMRTILQHTRNLSVFAEYQNEIMHPQRYETDLDRVLCFKSEINAMRALYYACLDLDANELPRIEQIIELLFLVEQYYSKCQRNIESEWLYFSPDVLEQPPIARQKSQAVAKYLSNLSSLEPLRDTYVGFLHKYRVVLEPHEYYFNEKFNTNVEPPKEGQSSNQPAMQCCLHFWQRPKFADELRKLLWDYYRGLPHSDIQDIILNEDIKILSELILDTLDGRLEDVLRESRPTICTKHASVRWQADSLESAEYLALYSDLVQRKQYRICRICGALFEVPTRYKTKLYCDRHNANQKQYHNRKMNEI